MHGPKQHRGIGAVLLALYVAILLVAVFVMGEEGKDFDVDDWARRKGMQLTETQKQSIRRNVEVTFALHWIQISTWFLPVLLFGLRLSFPGMRLWTWLAGHRRPRWKRVLAYLLIALAGTFCTMFVKSVVNYIPERGVEYWSLSLALVVLAFAVRLYIGRYEIDVVG